MKQEFFYLRAKPDEKGHVHRVGIFGIFAYTANRGTLGVRYVVKASFCSEEDNFDSKMAKQKLSNTDKDYTTADKERLKGISFRAFLRKFGMAQVAERQNLDYEKAEAVYKKLLDDIFLDTVPEEAK